VHTFIDACNRSEIRKCTYADIHIFIHRCIRIYIHVSTYTYACMHTSNKQTDNPECIHACIQTHAHANFAEHRSMDVYINTYVYKMQIHSVLKTLSNRHIVELLSLFLACACARAFFLTLSLIFSRFFSSFLYLLLYLSRSLVPPLSRPTARMCARVRALCLSLALCGACVSGRHRQHQVIVTTWKISSLPSTQQRVST